MYISAIQKSFFPSFVSFCQLLDGPTFRLRTWNKRVLFDVDISDISQETAVTNTSVMMQN